MTFWFVFFLAFGLRCVVAFPVSFLIVLVYNWGFVTQPLVREWGIFTALPWTEGFCIAYTILFMVNLASIALSSTIKWNKN
jgi:hypothetical protein